jgi:hypothetical protein
MAEKKAVADELQKQLTLVGETAAKQAAAEEAGRAAVLAVDSVKEKILQDTTYHQKELEQLRTSMQAQLAERDGLVELLKLRLHESSQLSASEVQEARRMISESSRETEEHKTKRMTARQEVVQMAQALERVQAEAEEMNQYLQFNLMPMVTEQVSGMKDSLKALDRCTERVASARAHKFKNNRSFENAFGESKSPRSSAGRGVLFSSSAGPEPSVCMMDRATGLRSELDQLQVGMTLLTQSVERLHDVVLSETRSGCCGGFFDEMSTVTHIGADGGGSRPSKKGYAALTEETDFTRSPRP